MVFDEYPEYGIIGPAPDASTGSSIHLHVDDLDAKMQRAVTIQATKGARFRHRIPMRFVFQREKN